MRHKFFKKRAGVITCLFLFSQIGFSQSFVYFSPQQAKAFSAVLDMDFHRARQLVGSNEPLDFQIKSLSACLESFLLCDKKKYQEGRSLEIKWLDSLSKFRECPNKRFAQAQVKLQWGFMANAYGERLTAALGMRQAFLLLKENHKKYPQHKPTMLYYGMMCSFFSEIPDHYQWLAVTVGLQGDKREGEYLVQRCKGEDTLLDLENRLWGLLKKPNSEKEEMLLLKECDGIVSDYGQYTLVNLFSAFYYLKNKHSTHAMSRLKLFSSEFCPFADYLKGNSAFLSLGLDSASFYFKSFLKRSTSDCFKKDALLKIAYIYYLKGEDEQAKRQLFRVKHTGSEVMYADKLAQKHSSSFLPSENLLKARIQFEGGFWEPAKKYLEQWVPIDSIEKSEYYYRLGRICQKMGKKEEGMSAYKKGIAMSPKRKVYYGPFSCVYLAEMYLEDQNMPQTRYYLELSNKFGDYEFAQSLISRKKTIEKYLK